MNIKVIYLLGAGRSGTTLLGTLLDSNPKICTIGEMHQFLEHFLENKNCSCGKALQECDFWGEIIKNSNFGEIDLKLIYQSQNQKERHINIPFLLLKTNPDKSYLEFQNLIFESISKEQKGRALLDSSKYIARYLLLKRSDKFNVKGIYIIRDVRGVINSFSKKVQTPKTAISTIVYYLLINIYAEILCRMDKEIIKIKYEELVNSPLRTIDKIHKHVFGLNSTVESIPKTFKMPHIIGGNRMKINSNITINVDEKWKDNISRSNQIFYYILAAPLMLLNRYRI